MLIGYFSTSGGALTDFACVRALLLRCCDQATVVKSQLIGRGEQLLFEWRSNDCAFVRPLVPACGLKKHLLGGHGWVNEYGIIGGWTRMPTSESAVSCPTCYSYDIARVRHVEASHDELLNTCI